MIHPGVDIVYLPDALQKKRSDHPRYREIVFHPSELQYIDSAPDPELMVHIFWAAKEAAYKSYVRNEVSSFRFIPHHVEIVQVLSDDLSVKYTLSAKVKDELFMIEARIAEKYVLASVKANATTEILPAEDLTKSEVRKLLQEYSASVQQRSGNEALFSYSHDGPYAAVSYVVRDMRSRM